MCVQLVTISLVAKSINNRYCLKQKFLVECVPRKGGISQRYGPRVILLGTVIDYKHHCQLEKGKYVKIHEKTDNTFKQWKEPALFLLLNS